MVILSPHPRSRSAYLYPLQDGRPCLQNCACAASNSSTLPPFGRAFSVPPFAFVPLDPTHSGKRDPLSPLHPLLHPVPHYSLLRSPPPPQPPSTTPACPSPVWKIFLPPFSSRDHLRRPPPSPVPSLDHPDLPFLSLDHSDRSRNKYHPHLPRFPFSSVTSMIILRPAINREKGEGLAIGCRFDPAFMEGSICPLDLDSTLVILDGSKSSLPLLVSHNKKNGTFNTRSPCTTVLFIRYRGDFVFNLRYTLEIRWVQFQLLYLFSE